SRVHENRQWDRGLVRVPRVRCPHLDDAHLQGHADLVRGEPGAVRGAHRLDQIVDQPLDRGDVVDGGRDFAQHRVTDAHDVAHAHRTRPPLITLWTGLAPSQYT